MGVRKHELEMRYLTPGRYAVRCFLLAHTVGLTLRRMFMDSGMIGKIQKAKLYAEERDRIEFTQFSVTLHGENHDHLVTYQNGQWDCQCNFFVSHGVCSHTMAMERVLGEMLRPANEPATAFQPA